MKKACLNIVVDAGWGSSAKGLVTSYLAWAHSPEILSTTSMPNAGHTAILPDGTKFISKAFPSSAILNLVDSYNPEVVIGAGGAFHLPQLFKELEECKNPNLTIHPRAGVVTEDHKSRESGEGGTKHVASTMQGCGSFLSDKVLRKPDLKLAGDYAELQEFSPRHLSSRLKIESDYLPEILITAMDKGNTILHEGSQGFGLDINHGNSYPNCTSRQCTALQSAADLGIPHQYIGDVYLVIRPYPIRVGNVIENNQLVGYSGDAYPNQEEISWEEVAKRCGTDIDLTSTELTTVTKRLRRVFEWSDTQFNQAYIVNGATKIVLNFANYIDWSCYGKNSWDELGTKVHDWIKKFEDTHNIPIALVGTGPKVDQVCVRP